MDGTDVTDDQIEIRHRPEKLQFECIFKDDGKKYAHLTYKLKDKVFDPYIMSCWMRNKELIDLMLIAGFGWAESQGMKVRVSNSYIGNESWGFLKKYPERKAQFENQQVT